VRDPISGAIEFAFFICSLALALWIAIDTRRSLELLFPRVKLLSEREVRFFKILSTFCAWMLSVFLVSHLLRRP
jgi:hypothetical protein